MAVSFQKKEVASPSPFKPLGMESLLEEYADLQAKHTVLMDTMFKVKTQIAIGMCPYKVGQTIFTKTGLGLHGLVIQEVCFPLDFQEGNYWMLRTFAKTKAGQVSSRFVGIEQAESGDITKVE